MPARASEPATPTNTLAGRHTGTIGDIGCFSFNGNKIITTGGGGMIVTEDDRCAARARYLTTQAKDDAVRYVHNEVGYNFRLTNLQAALGVAQLEQLERFLALKQTHYRAFKEQIDAIPWFAARRASSLRKLQPLALCASNPKRCLRQGLARS